MVAHRRPNDKNHNRANPVHCRSATRRPSSVSSSHASNIPCASHVRAHTIDNGAGVQRGSLNVTDFRLGKVLGAGGTATVIRAEFLSKPGRPDLRRWVNPTSDTVYHHPYTRRSAQVYGHRRQPSSPPIGAGSYAPDMPHVRHARQNATIPRPLRHMPPLPPREVALKVVQKKCLSRRARHYLTREIAIHRALYDHNNVVTLLDVFEDGSSIYMVQELMRGGDLFSALKRERRGVGERVALAITAQILQALAFMHERGFAHRDIKPENVMFAERPTLSDGRVGTVKLIDFGLACARDPNAPVSERTSSEKCGTVRYAAPEIVTESWYIPELADVWSVGVVLYSAIAYNNPFTGKSEKEVLECIECGSVSFEGTEWRDVSEGTKNLICWMLRRKPSERPSAQCALQEAHGIMRERGDIGYGRVCRDGRRESSGQRDGEHDVSGFPSVVTPEKRGEGRVEEARHGPNLFDGIRALFSGGA